MRKRGPAVMGRLIDEAAARDAKIAPIDWTKRPEEIKEWTFLAPSGPLAAVRCGDISAPMVILLPGLTGSKEDFALLMPLLAERGYQSVSMDLAGQYESHGDKLFAPASYDWDLFTHDIEALLELTGPAHLLGLSFAGQVAERVAVEMPDYVLSLTLMSAPPVAGNVFEKVKIGGALARVLKPSFLGRILLPALKLNLNRAEKQRAAFVRRRVDYHDPKSVSDVLVLMSDSPDLSRRLAELDIPVLLTTGSHDLWPLELHQQRAEQIGASTAFYCTGHSPCETTPNQLTRDMIALFEGK